MGGPKFSDINFEYSLLADALGSGTSDAVTIPNAGDAVLQLEREAPNAFQVTIEERIDKDDFGWAPLITLDETDLASGYETLTHRFSPTAGAEMRVNHNSGEAVTVGVNY